MSSFTLSDNNVIEMNYWCKMILGINVCFYDDTQKEERNKTLGNGVYVVFMMHDFWTCKTYFSRDYYYRKNNNFSLEKYALHVQPTSLKLNIDTSRKRGEDGKMREYGKTIELTSLTSNIKSCFTPSTSLIYINNNRYNTYIIPNPIKL